MEFMAEIPMLQQLADHEGWAQFPLVSRIEFQYPPRTMRLLKWQPAYYECVFEDLVEFLNIIALMEVICQDMQLSYNALYGQPYQPDMRLARQVRPDRK